MKPGILLRSFQHPYDVPWSHWWLSMDLHAAGEAATPGSLGNCDLSSTCFIPFPQTYAIICLDFHSSAVLEDTGCEPGSFKYKSSSTSHSLTSARLLWSSQKLHLCNDKTFWAHVDPPYRIGQNTVVRLPILHPWDISAYNVRVNYGKLIGALSLPICHRNIRMFQYPEIWHMPGQTVYRWTMCDMCWLHTSQFVRNANMFPLLMINFQYSVVEHPVCDCSTSCLRWPKFQFFR